MEIWRPGKGAVVRLQYTLPHIDYVHRQRFRSLWRRLLLRLGFGRHGDYIVDEGGGLAYRIGPDLFILADTAEDGDKLEERAVRELFPEKPDDLYRRLWFGCGVVAAIMALIVVLGYRLAGW